MILYNFEWVKKNCLKLLMQKFLFSDMVSMVINVPVAHVSLVTGTHACLRFSFLTMSSICPIRVSM